MKKDMMKSILRLLVTFLVASACLFGYINVDSQEITKVEYFDSANVINKIIESLPEKEEVQEVKEETPETTEAAVLPVENVVHYEPQPEVVATPVIQGDSIEVAGIQRKLMKDETGDHFYLNHNINGDYDGIGVPYIDFRHDFTGRKTIIYSHSSVLGNGPFQALQNYHNNPGFYWNNRMITIHYQGETYNYEIFSVYVSVADSEESEGLEYFHTNYYTPDAWEATIQKYRNNSEYDTGVSVSGDDKILILQTCSMDPNYYQKYYRYNLLIMGKLV